MNAPPRSSVCRAAQAFQAIAWSLKRLHGAGWPDVDLTLAQLRALSVIGTEGPIHGRGLAQVLGVGQPAVSKLVEQLVEHGYVRREEDRDDRRVVWLRPTETGLAVFERISLARQDWIVRLLDTLGDGELTEVCRALDIVARAAERLANREASTSSTEAHP